MVAKTNENKILEDSFKIIVTNYNVSGKPMSTHIGVK